MTQSINQPTVYIVDDDTTVADLLALLLQSTGYLTRGFASAEDFLDSYQPDMRGCLLLDIDLPDMDGLQLQSELIAVGAALPIIFVTGTAHVTDAVQALKSGALEFLEKPYNVDSMLHLVATAIDYDRNNREEIEHQRSVAERIKSLTPRENEVLTHIVNGHPSKVIAVKMNLSQRTVDVYRSNIMRKMQTRSLVTLAQMCVYTRDWL